MSRKRDRRRERGRKYQYLTDEKIVELIRAEVFFVDVETGVVRTRKKTLTHFKARSRGRKNVYYPTVILHYKGARKNIVVHKLVMMAELMAVIPPDCDVDHKDRDTTNPVISNLRIRRSTHNRARTEYSEDEEFT